MVSPRESKDLLALDIIEEDFFRLLYDLLNMASLTWMARTILLWHIPYYTIKLYGGKYFHPLRKSKIRKHLSYPALLVAVDII